MEESIIKGLKILEVSDKGLTGARGYKIYHIPFDSNKEEFIGEIIDNYSIFSHFKLIRRFLRAEVNNLYSLSNGEKIVIAKKGLFKKEKNSKKFIKIFDIKRGSRPLNLCITPNENLYFGEYFANMSKKEVHIYKSNDKGETWQIAYTFTNGNINHVHGIFWDKYSEAIWFVTGDRENECIIGYTKDEFKHVVEVFRGDQEFRATILLFYRDFIVFGTDSQYIKNQIKLINRDTKEIISLQDIQGSAIKGGQYEDFAFLSTTVEPSKVNLDKKSHLWITKDGRNWEEIYSQKKDYLPSIFQFGSIEFPRYICPIEKHFVFSGRALDKIDGNSVILDLEK